MAQKQDKNVPAYTEVRFLKNSTMAAFYVITG
jgi:hypothetical protein